MHMIAELDTELSRAGTSLHPRQKHGALSRCAKILDGADDNDEEFIGQAVHCLLRKHGLEQYWSDSRAPGG